jgi:hypothetical protein
LISRDYTDLHCFSFLIVLPSLTDKPKWKIISLLPILVLCIITLLPTSAYSILQFNTITRPNANMVENNALVSQPSSSASGDAQTIPKVFYSRWGFGVIDLWSSPVGAGSIPNCQMGGVNPNLNNFYYNFNHNNNNNNNNNNNILSLASPEIAVIYNLQANNMIGIGQNGQPFQTSQQVAPFSISRSPGSPITATMQQPIRSVKVMLPNGFLDELTIIQALQLQPGTYSVVSNNCTVDTLQVPLSSASSIQTQPAANSAAPQITPPVQSASAPLLGPGLSNAQPSTLVPQSNSISPVTPPSLPFPAQIIQSPPSFGLPTILNGQTILPGGQSSNSPLTSNTFQSPFQLRPIQPSSPPFPQVTPP